MRATCGQDARALSVRAGDRYRQARLLLSAIAAHATPGLAETVSLPVRRLEVSTTGAE